MQSSSAADLPASRIRVATAADGTLTYLVDLPPEQLPAVRGRDLEMAWEAAHAAARRQLWGAARLIRFCRLDGSHSDFALADRDARCWARAVDASVGIESCYGMALCLRLLALVDVLARAPTLGPLFSLGRGGAEFHPALLRAAATAPLTAEARFDVSGFCAALARLPAPGSGSGASA